MVRITFQEVLNKAKEAAGAAVDSAKEGLSKAFNSAKNIVSGFTSCGSGGKPAAAEEAGTAAADKATEL